MFLRLHSLPIRAQYQLIWCDHGDECSADLLYLAHLKNRLTIESLANTIVARPIWQTEVEMWKLCAGMGELTYHARRNHHHINLMPRTVWETHSTVGFI